MILLGILIGSIEVISRETDSVVTQGDSIDVDHWDQNQLCLFEDL